MQPVVIALAANERYFPGLYCAIASSLSYLDPSREVDVKVLDGGIFEESRTVLSRLMAGFGRSTQLQFIPIDESTFRGATLGPGRSHMTYCRILLPRVLDAHRLIYLDCDLLVFRDLSQLFDLELPPGKVVAAVPDSETLSLKQDSQRIVDAVGLPGDNIYFNCGVMLMNLDALRDDSFTEKSMDFFKRWKGHYRFWDQSAFNFLLQGRIAELPGHWNRASWRFDEQDNNKLECVLHYTTSAPWLGGKRGPAQMLFERFAAEAGLPVNRQNAVFKRSIRRQWFRDVLAPFRAVGFFAAALFYKFAGRREKSVGYRKVACYWRNYILHAPRRHALYRSRADQIQNMKFTLVACESVR
jgi:lipopolysaccharide biosynthesis glycosyltransferase